jgi:hypothetical protein
MASATKTLGNGNNKQLPKIKNAGQRGALTGVFDK